MFNKDLLIIDVEATGVDYQKHELIELAGILLDKKTLKEKRSFNSLIQPKYWGRRDPEAMAVNQITWNQLKNAPKLKSVLQKFQRTFGTNLILSAYGTIMDTAMLRIAYKQCKLSYKFDYHVFDIWPLCYAYMAKKKLLTNRKRFAGFSLEDLAEHLRIQVPENRHTALADCQLQAEVLRRLLKKFKV
ncbi:MAG TPA: 3'-5' exonuclease [Candidatus Doudnabacteria bacterium]|mgnify:CR=1 FL=1|nr:3'-5' exonuclease [Candidatus Doudnabacteria bacterium]